MVVLEKTNLTYIEPHRVIIKNITFLVFNSKMNGIDVLFLLLFHLLGLLPERENYQPLSPEMKQEDVTNLRQKYRNKLRNCTDENLNRFGNNIRNIPISNPIVYRLSRDIFNNRIRFKIR